MEKKEFYTAVSSVLFTDFYAFLKDVNSFKAPGESETIVDIAGKAAENTKVLAEHVTSVIFSSRFAS